MSVQLEYYTYSNGDTVAAVLNAVATFFSTSSFASLLSMSAMIAVVSTTAGFFITRNPAHLYKFFATFLLVPLMLINMTANMQVIDLTEGRVNSVSNVPYLVALPTHFSTALMYGFTDSIESIFNVDLTGTEEYGKTGIVFGSALYNLSSKSLLIDSETKRQWHDFFTSCIIRDVTINHKYTFQDLLDAPDIWTFIDGQNMSPLRGMFMAKNAYMTCKEAKPVIEKAIDDGANANLIRQAQQLYGKEYLNKVTFLKSAVQDSYRRYADISKNASDITKQNMTMNEIRNSVNDTGGTAGALNYAYTQNKSQTTAMWAGIALQAKEYVPMMHTILFLLFGCSGIFVAIAAMIPSMTVPVLTNYVKTFATLAIWPALFAFLNFIMTKSLAQTTLGITDVMNGVTLSNANALDEMHMRFGVLAGFLTISVPVIANTIMKGGGAVMSSLNYQVVGMINGTNTRTSAAAASGDLDFGNMRIDNQSYNNLSANKRDDTLLNREGTGMSSTLGRDGVTTNKFGNGEKTYDANQTYSNLGYTIGSQEQFSQSISTALNNQEAISRQNLTNLSETTTKGLGMSDRLGISSSDSKNNSASHASGDSVNVNKGVDKMDSAVTSVMASTGFTKDEAQSYLHSASAGIDGSVSSPSLFGLAKVSASASAKFSDDDTERFSHMDSTQENDVKTALLQYRDGANMVSDASTRLDATESNSTLTQDAHDFSGNWNTTKVQAETANKGFAMTDSLTKARSEVQSGSLSIGENLVDDFQRFVTESVHDTAPQGMSEKQKELKVKDVLTAQTGDNKATRDSDLTKFQHSDAFQVAVLKEALPTHSDMVSVYNGLQSPQLTSAQTDAREAADNKFVSYFSDKSSKGELLFNVAQHDQQTNTVENKMESTRADINAGREKVEEVTVDTRVQGVVEKELEPLMKGNNSGYSTNSRFDKGGVDS
jgi:conjugal transfer mating pair stabilization protein TraG